MTSQDIHRVVSAVRPVSHRQVLRWLEAHGLRPLGTIRTRPRFYCPDTAKRLLSLLGLSSASVHLHPATARAGAISAAVTSPKKLISVRTLRAARPKKQTNKK